MTYAKKYGKKKSTKAFYSMKTAAILYPFWNFYFKLTLGIPFETEFNGCSHCLKSPVMSSLIVTIVGKVPKKISFVCSVNIVVKGQ